MNRRERGLLKRVGRASKRFSLLEPGDRVLVAVSGGKDSLSMLVLLRHLQRKVPFDFSLVAFNLHAGQPGYRQDQLGAWFEAQGYEHHLVRQDIRSVCQEKIAPGKTWCSLCSRMRRGILYSTAAKLGATKIALGHHTDDLIESLLLNMLYSGQIGSMPPRLTSDDGRNTVIRPLIYCHESELAAYAEEQHLPVIGCGDCESVGIQYRARIKRLITSLNEDNDKVRSNLMAALANVHPSHLLDESLWDHREGTPRARPSRPPPPKTSG